ncbi:PKD domain-containing protein [Tenacibaculum sp.]|uniref:PKD domain-containing protein n=1 Tax=Tenacibaculum sp. TaxID=1906242 RepID=UPI003AA8BD00
MKKRLLYFLVLIIASIITQKVAALTTAFGRVEYKTSVTDRNNVSKADLEDKSNYLYGEAHQAMSTKVFTNLSLLVADPIIGVAKDATVSAQQVTFDYYIENLGDVDLSSLSLSDDLDAVFGTGNYTVISQPSFIDNPGTINLNTDFNGNINTQIITGGSTLAIGRRAQIRLVIQVTNVTDQGLGIGNYSSQSIISASDTIITVDDLSDNGTDPDPNGNSVSNEAGENDPTTFTIAPPPCSVATRLYVDSNAKGSNNGTSWVNAFTNLQDALNCIDDGEEIWVASGTYHPNSAPGTTLTNPTEFYFWMNKNIKLKGSYNPATNTQDFTNPSILSGDLGTTNTVHVLVTTNLNNTALIEGFTMTKGAAIHDIGSVTIGGQVIHNNRGGGIYNASSSPIFKNITISENKAQYGGGGMYNVSSSPVILNLLCTNNTVQGKTYRFKPSDNGYGGGMFNSASSPTITNTIFAYNKVVGGYGGTEPSGHGHGGGIYNEASSSITITNTVFIYNSAAGGVSTWSLDGAGYGAGIFNESSPASLVNVTFFNNSATTNGGGMHSYASNTSLYNTIFYGNGADISSLGGSTFMGADNFSENYTGTGFTQLTANPFIVPTLPKGKDGIWATSDDGLRLIATSPAVDTGNNANLPTDSFDLDGDGNTTERTPYDVAGEDRVQNTTVNIGAYEGVASCSYPTATTLYVNASISGGTNDGSSWTNAYNNLQDAIWQTYICSNITEIWVAKGTYKPLNETTAIEIPEGVSLYGGFAGTETALNDRDWTVNPTVLSGDFNDNKTPDAGDSHTIIRMTNSNSTLDGFIIAYSYADGTENNPIAIGRSGGGVYNNGNDNTINHCIFKNNITQGDGTNGIGGAIVSFSTGTLTLYNSAFYNNEASANGGAFSVENGITKLINCTVANNIANKGGGVHFHGGNLEAINTIFFDNTGTNGNINDDNPSGGGIGTVAYCAFYNSTTGNNGEIPPNITDGSNNIAATAGSGDVGTVPLFTDAANNDYGLQNTSSLLNEGNNAANSEAKDLGNKARILGTTIDIGAYESDEILVDFTISGGYCVGNEVIFTDNSSSPNGAIVNWEWDFGDGNTSTEQNPTHIYTDTINAEIKLKVIDITGKESTITKTFSVQSPKAKFNANPRVGQAFPHTVFFTDQSTLPDIWNWDFGDGGTSTAQNPIHTYIAAGDYTVNLMVRDTMNGCTSKVTDLIKIVIPKAQFSVDDTLGCGPFTVNFTDESTIEGNDTIEEWLWDFGDGNTSTEQNPSHTYESVGIYNVSLTIKTAITGFTNTNTKSKFIQVIGANPDFSADVTTGCDPLTVRFSDATVFYGPPSDWLWDFGDGTTSNLSNPTHTYTENGEFDVSLTVTDIDGCSKTIIKKAYINTTETTAPTVLIQNITVPLDASGVVTITAADIDNGSYDNCGIGSISLDKTTFNCSDVGINTVTLNVTDTSGNSNTATATVTVEDNTQPTVICQDITVSLDDTGIATITAADIDNGSMDACGISSMSLDNTTFDCTDIGVNTVTLTVTDVNGNSDMCTATVTVEDTTVPTVVCRDITVPLDASGNAAITAADIDNGSMDACGISSMSLDKTTFDCTDIGVNTVTLTVTDVNGNSNTCIATITVEDTTVPTVVCRDITVSLDDTGIATISTADIDNGSIDACGISSMSLDNTTFDCTDIGVNTVTLTVTDVNGNSNTCIATITVEDTTVPTVVCRDITVSLDDTGIATISTADIDNGSMDACGISSMSLDKTTFDCTDIGVNTITLTVTDVNGNSDTCIATVTVEDTTVPTVICQDITVQLDDSGMITITADNIDKGSTDVCGIASMSLDITNFDTSNVGDNMVNLTVTDVSGNTNTCTAIVRVEDVTPPIAITKDIEVELDAHGNAIIASEDINDGSYDASGIVSMSLSNTNFTCPTLTEHTVVLTVIDANGLSSSEEAIVTFTATDLDNDLIADICDNDIDGDGVLNENDNCPTTANADQKDLDANGIGDICDSGGLTIPKGFSPNSDGINDEFIIKGLHKYASNKIEVYNRWGNRVYHSTNYQNNWNGEGDNQDKKLPAGSYFYVLSIDGDKRVLKGWVYINY